MSGALEQSRRLAEQLEAVVVQLNDFTGRLREQFAVEREEARNGDEPAEQ